MSSSDRRLLERLERYYDMRCHAQGHGPRTSARSRCSCPREPSRSTPGRGWASSSTVAPEDVAAVVARQRALGVPVALEWVVETTPSLTAAARAAGLEIQELPLLVLDRCARGAGAAGGHDPPRRGRRGRPRADHGGRGRGVRERWDLGGRARPGGAGRGRGLEHRRPDETAGADRDGRRRDDGRGRHGRAGGDRRPPAGRRHHRDRRRGDAPDGATTGSRRRRHRSARRTCDGLGPRPRVPLAASDDVARIYERLGFRRVAQAGIADAPAHDPAGPDAPPADAIEPPRRRPRPAGSRCSPPATPRCPPHRKPCSAASATRPRPGHVAPNPGMPAVLLSWKQ